MRKAKNNKDKRTKAATPTHKPLGEHLEIGGFALDLIKREGDIGMFSKERIKKPWCDHYRAGVEVVVIKRHNGYTLGNQYIEPAETYPCNSLWGVLGWSFDDRLDAEVKFQELVHKQKQKTLVTEDAEGAQSSDDE